MMKEVFIRRKKGFRTNEENLLRNLVATYPNLKLDSVEIYYYYELINMTESLQNLVIENVISENYVDSKEFEVNLDGYYYFVEPLKNQFDVRKNSALECVKLLEPTASDYDIKTATLFKFNGINNDDYEMIYSSFINKIENQLKSNPTNQSFEKNLDLPVIGFTKFSNAEYQEFYDTHGFAMDYIDFKYLIEYYKKINKDPRVGEFKILDTYWSDHCRHTTFNTILTDIKIEDESIKEAFESVRHYFGEEPTLMKMAANYAKEQIKSGKFTKKEDTIEDNAISIVIEENNEKYLLQFKNETHNHPTEIEPFGGAATCIGGAIRDPLSGRAYVYQGMRIAGSGDIFQTPGETLENKLFQRTISHKASDGFSSYGNQIGIPTLFNKEIYHDSYVAKHLELGCVVGVCRQDNVLRADPTPGDIVIMLGGKTGMDGIGGATGSSKIQNEDALINSAAEVQKGNAPEERNLLRLFTTPEFSKIIKKSNDFGAGGVSVCVLELASGCDIYLDQVKLKTLDMSVLDIALSESQERMAIVIDKSHEQIVYDLARENNVLYAKIGDVTDKNHVNIYYDNELVYDFGRELLDSSGAVHTQDVYVPKQVDVNYNKYSDVRELVEDRNLNYNKLQDEKFDSTVLGNTILMPYGGKNQNIKSQVSIARIHELEKLQSVVSYGFNPDIMAQNSFVGSQMAVIDSVTKQVANGVLLDDIILSFQEYFKRMNNDALRFGAPFMTLLGAFHAQKNLDLLALGGKDSMSGTYLDIDVVDTFVSFALGVKKIDKTNVNYFTSLGDTIYLTNFDNQLDYQNLIQSYKKYLDIYDEVTSCFVLGDDPIMSALLKMSHNDIGFDVETLIDELKCSYGTILFTSSNPNLDFIKIGTTSNLKLFNKVPVNNDFDLEYFKNVYPDYENKLKNQKENNLINYDLNPKLVETPRVLIPIFEGTNSYLELKRSYERYGAEVELFVFNDKYDIDGAIDKFVNLLSDVEILAFAGGFSKSDEPDGSAKYIANFIKNKKVSAAINIHLNCDKLIFGVCNGFQALLKSGLLTDQEDEATLFYNDCLHHISKMVKVCYAKSNSPFTSNLEHSTYVTPISHGEGRFSIDYETYTRLLKKGQIVSTYSEINPNQSDYNIEGIVSSCGRIYGKMGHAERYQEGLYVNIDGNKDCSIFKNMINYFKEK